MKMIVLGAGGTTRDLLRRLGDVWDVTVVDPDPERLALAAAVRRVTPVTGDGSSPVVLERVGVGTADAFVAATNDDDVNIEACRIAKEAGIVRLVATANDAARLPRYRELGVAAFSPTRLASHRIGITLDTSGVTSTSFADGLAEAIDVRINADSPVLGRTLAELHSSSWLVAAILRSGQLIIPHGGTVLRDGDLVTVVGAASDYPLILRAFTAAEARFPIDWGKRVAVAFEDRADLEGTVQAAVNLARNSSAESLLVVHRDESAVRDPAERAALEGLLGELAERSQGTRVRHKAIAGSPLKDILRAITGENVGVVVVPAPDAGLVGRWRAVQLIRQLRSAGRPALVVGAEPGFDEVVAVIRDAAAGWPAARAAIDLAAYGKTELVGVAPVAPLYPGGEEGRSGAVRAAARFRAEAEVQGLSVRRRFARGSPGRALESELGDRSLVIVPFPRFNPTFFRPGTVVKLMRRSPASVLLIPRAGRG